MQCTYCKRETRPARLVRLNDPLTRTDDHVVPLGRGGLDTKENRVPACLRCNSIKGDMMPDEWAAYMAANPMWWTLTRYQRHLQSISKKPLPMAHSAYILKHGKKAYREWVAVGCPT
ncbi:HNH endonuclease [Bradyrhizobium yuanmingense]|uniref:HNH endonuclease n=1 Tax=Bradyrhizobium yuanmingense TaxID=108015 RepID=A0A1C3XMG3_9BRAD|nr:HNH endonuclease [Bradyrhizobium yuanmingense]TWI19015.1 HNH endonuclease [Bradyrhizobium yuanmingense]SCB53453.1 HNH endonuclease [Bradyrhizobium yuanmingense]